jgi:hypothetical protein
VRLYADTVEHVRERHPEIPAELPSIQTAVERAIANPTRIESSYSDSYVYVDATSTNRSGDPLRVAVRRVEGTSGRVATFYFASAENQGNVVYRRENG